MANLVCCAGESMANLVCCARESMANLVCCAGESMANLVCCAGESMAVLLFVVHGGAGLRSEAGLHGLLQGRGQVGVVQAVLHRCEDSQGSPEKNRHSSRVGQVVCAATWSMMWLTV